MNWQWQQYFENARKLFRLTFPIFISQLSAAGMGFAEQLDLLSIIFICIRPT